MKIVRYPQNCPNDLKNSVIALGNFDGIHLGHQHILSEVCKQAEHHDTLPGILTFKPHPVSYFARNVEPFRLTPFRNKYNLLSRFGMQVCFLLHFNKKLSSLSAEDFVENILIEQLNVKHLVIGHDFIFGNQRKGNADLLKSYAKQNAFGLSQLDPVTFNKNTCSSTHIRSLIRNGNVKEASHMLGHDFVLSGRVIRGQQRGREFNFPTANIAFKQYIRPQFGIYTGSVRIENHDTWLPSAISIGTNPTFSDNLHTIEAHILDFNQDIYGKHIDIKLLEYIRPELKFTDIQSLITAMDADVTHVRHYFN